MSYYTILHHYYADICAKKRYYTIYYTIMQKVMPSYAKICQDDEYSI